MTLTPQAQAVTDAGKASGKRIDKADLLYIAGALLIVAGLGLKGPNGFEHALFAAGCFCLVFPVLELLSGFLRGLRK